MGLVNPIDAWDSSGGGSELLANGKGPMFVTPLVCANCCSSGGGSGGRGGSGGAKVGGA